MDKQIVNTFDRISYAQCWEDADVLTDALDVRPGQTCVSVASAGDNTLALLANSPGRVIALDHNPLQLHCLEIRAAAFKTLDYGAMLELLGSLESNRRLTLYKHCRAQLSADARAFWDAHETFVELGVGSVGRFERFLSTFRSNVLPWLMNAETVNAVIESGTPEWRAEHFDRKISTWRFTAAFRLFFSQFVVGRFGRHPDAFRHAKISIADHLLARVRFAFTVLDPAENPYLQWILTGRHVAALPFALRKENFETIRGNLDRLELRCQGVEECLQCTADGQIDRFNLSNVFEYMDEKASAVVFAEIARTGAPGARLAYWNTIVPRSCPANLHDRLAPLEQRAAALYSRDKAFFYNAFRLESVPE